MRWTLDLEGFSVQSRLAPNRNWLLEDVEDRAMGIDRLDQAGDILGRSRTGNIDREGHVLETSRYLCHSEEPAQVQPTLSSHLDAIQRDIKHPGVCGVDDFLAGT